MNPKSGFAFSVSTSTLSIGVNLPAHLVIVKATHMYVMGVAREYSDQQVLQMIGRAGRPQVIPFWASRKANNEWKKEEK